MCPASPPDPVVVVPTPQGPKIIGILNIVFGALLILSGLAQGLSLLAAPLFERAAEVQSRRQEAADAAARAERIAELRAEEEAAEGEEEKARLADRRRAVEASPKRFRPDLSRASSISRDPVIIAYQVAEIVSGLALNALMVAAGVGLIRLRAWGRSLAMWTAGLKAVWAVATAAIAIVVVLPITASQTREFLRQAMADMAASGIAPPRVLTLMSQYLGVFMVVSAVGTAVATLIYPAITLWVLTRPGARAACTAGGRKPGTGRADEAGLSYSGREFAE
jgi:hypothetical protein